MTPKSKTLPGIHIQWPWSQLLMSGKKTVETRGYALPSKYVGKPLALIETAGKSSTRKSGIKKARIIGIITFSESFCYKSETDWKRDVRRHLVPKDDPLFSFKPTKSKWGWVVESVSELKIPQEPPKKRGIVFALNCKI